MSKYINLMKPSKLSIIALAMLIWNAPTQVSAQRGNEQQGQQQPNRPSNSPVQGTSNQQTNRSNKDPQYNQSAKPGANQPVNQTQPNRVGTSQQVNQGASKQPVGKPSTSQNNKAPQKVGGPQSNNQNKNWPSKPNTTQPNKPNQGSQPKWGSSVKQKPNNSMMIQHQKQNYQFSNGVFYKYANGKYSAGPAPIGARINGLPTGSVRVIAGTLAYYYYYGTYYRYTGPSQYQVVVPPVGAVVYYLPDGYSRVVIDRNTYYTYDGIYYRAFIDQNGEVAYQVVGDIRR
jgi:hypothetical protein